MTDDEYTWVFQIKGGAGFLEHLTREVEAARVEAHSDSTRRRYFDRLLDGCRTAKRIGTGGTVGTVSS
jgi:hypothetical protein